MIKIFSSLPMDIMLAGLIGFNFVILQVNAFALALDATEKFLLFSLTLILGIYRVYLYHLDAEKKRMENIKMKRELRKTA